MAPVKNQIPFTYARDDIWFAYTENMLFVKNMHKEFAMPLKGNRKVFLSRNFTQHGRYQRLDTLEEDGLTGFLYLMTGDTTLNGSEIIVLCQNDSTWSPITNRSNRMLRWKNHPAKQITLWRHCVDISSWICSKATPNSITLCSSRNSICVPSVQPMLPCGNSPPLNWPRELFKHGKDSKSTVITNGKSAHRVSRCQIFRTR